MSRTILIHLNVQIPDNPDYGADEVADMILSAIEVGSDADEFRNIMGEQFFVGDLASGQGAPIVVALAEEV